MKIWKYLELLKWPLKYFLRVWWQVRKSLPLDKFTVSEIDKPRHSSVLRKSISAAVLIDIPERWFQARTSTRNFQFLQVSSSLLCLWLSFITLAIYQTFPQTWPWKSIVTSVVRNLLGLATHVTLTWSSPIEEGKIFLLFLTEWKRMAKFQRNRYVEWVALLRWVWWQI